MTEARGMLTIEELAEQVAEGHIDTIDVAFTDLYGRLVGKRYDAGFFLEEVPTGGAHACDYLLTVDMEMEPVPGYEFTNWEKGYGDLHLAPDMSTLRRISWRERTALVLCDVVHGEGHDHVPEAPRSLLSRQLERAAEAGLDARAASELEFYIFEDTYREAAESSWHDLRPSGWYIEDYHLLQTVREEPLVGSLRRHLSASGVPVENSKGEWGLGQHELNIRHAPVLEMADRHVLYKQCAKEVADQLGQSVTFMAKPYADRAGSSCHVHLSLWRNGRNAFAGERDLAGIACSDEFRWFLGGWMAHAPDVMALYASTVNAYKRYQSGSWAPTGLAWSYDNRTVGFRVVGSGPSLRIECRLPGADCNPYLAYAAALASGLDGIERQIEPPPIFEGDAYQADAIPRLPSTLADATSRFESSEFVRESFGPQVTGHYAHFLRSEQAAYDRAVTDWERGRYFEQI